jgi:hypothetical protein
MKDQVYLGTYSYDGESFRLYFAYKGRTLIAKNKNRELRGATAYSAPYVNLAPRPPLAEALIRWQQHCDCGTGNIGLPQACPVGKGRGYWARRTERTSMRVYHAERAYHTFPPLFATSDANQAKVRRVARYAWGDHHRNRRAMRNDGYNSIVRGGGFNRQDITYYQGQEKRINSL